MIAREREQKRPQCPTIKYEYEISREPAAHSLTMPTWPGEARASVQFLFPKLFRQRNPPHRSAYVDR